MPIENSAEKLFKLSNGNSSAVNPAWFKAMFKVVFGRGVLLDASPHVAELVTRWIMAVSQLRPPGPLLMFTNK
jgi:hypothetical protein